jgi:tetratricopeptide (TPR) repeat protein
MDVAAAPLELARHYLRIDRPERALEALASASSGDVETPQFWRIRAAALADLRRWDEGAEAARRGLSLAAEDIGLLEVLAICRLERDPAEAERALRDAVALAPWNPSLLANLALVLARRKRFDEALATIDKALSAAPESRQVLQVRAQIALLAKDKRADDYTRALLANAPESDTAHALHGTAAVRNRNIDAGLRHYIEAARLDPSDPRMTWLARRSRAFLHPAGAPLRLLWRIGPRRVQIAIILLSVVFAAAGLASVRLALGVGWLLVLVYSYGFRMVVRARYGKEPK